MLRCKDVADRASDYVNRDLPLVERLQVWWHLSMCYVCRRYVRQMRQAVALLRRMGRETAAPSDDDAQALFRSSHKK